MGPFQVILGNFQAIRGLLSGDFRQFSGDFRQFQAIWGHTEPGKKPVLIDKKKAEDCTPNMSIFALQKSTAPKAHSAGEGGGDDVLLSSESMCPNPKMR